MTAAAPPAAAAFTESPSPPRPTFPLVVASVSVAVLAMHADAVAQYSAEAFWAGVIATMLLAIVVGRVVAAIRRPRARIAAALLLPAAFGGGVGVLVQALVLTAVRSSSIEPPIVIRDMGGLVDTSDTPTWLLGGVVLGAAPAFVVSLFLVLAARALGRLVGNDAPEGFAVAFTGMGGVVAAFGLVAVDAGEGAPLAIAAFAASVSLLAALLVDGSRIAFVRRAFAGGDGAFQIVPHDASSAHASLAAVVGQAAPSRVLVHVERRPGSYRAAAAAPIALLADTEEATLTPLRRRRAAALAMLVSIGGLVTLAAFAHGLVG